jgi:hypothetical protein
MEELVPSPGDRLVIAYGCAVKKTPRTYSGSFCFHLDERYNIILDKALRKTDDS